MKRALYVLNCFALLLLAVVSCEKESELQLIESRIIRIRPALAEMTKATETSFEAGDTVGIRIYMPSGIRFAENDKFVYDGTCLKSSDGLEWYEGDSTCTIVACYPLDPDYTGNTRYTYDAAVDQSRYEDYLASDLLVGTARNVMPGSTVDMVFYHKCTQLQLNVINDTAEEIRSVKFLELDRHQSLSYDFSGFTGDNYPEVDIIPYHQGNVGGAEVYKALVPGVQTNTFKVEITTSERTLHFTTQNAFCFACGTVYMATVTLDSSPSESGSISISAEFGDWNPVTLQMFDENDGQSGTGDSFASFDEMYAASTGKTYTAATPMGSHYIGAHTTTSEDIDWLLDPDNEPSTLPSAPGYTFRTYDVTLYPFGTPLPADVNQHGIGDCSACAVFAEMAYVAPEFIKSIITDHGDGTYTVRMYDPQGQPVNVRVSSKFLGSSSIGAVSGKNNVACWSTVLEKAMMKWEYIYRVNPDVTGIGSEHVLPLFTGEGKSFAFSPGMLSASKLKSAVNLSFGGRCLIIGGFNQSGIAVGSSLTVSAHAYSFIKASSDSELFIMRNPWGFSSGDGNTYTDGLLHIQENSSVPPMIDIRVIFPGALAAYYKDDLGSYTPPSFSGASEFQRFLQSERKLMEPYR